MEEDKRKVLIDVLVNTTKSVNSTTDLVKEVSKLRAEQKKLDATTEEGARAYEAYGSIIRKTNVDLRQKRKETDSLIKAKEAEDGSLNQLKATLSNLTAEYNSMSKASREGAEGKAMQVSILEVTDALKDGEKAIGNYRREIGQYEQGVLSAITGNNKFLATLLGTASESKATGGAFSILGGKAKMLGKSLYALAINPIVLTLIAIVGACILLYKAFQRSEDQGDRLGVAMAKLGSIFKTLLKLIEPISEFIVDELIVGVDFLLDSIEEVMVGIEKAMRFLGLNSTADWIRGVTDEYKSMTEASKELAESQARLTAQERELKRSRSDLQKQAKEYLSISKDTTKSLGERLDASKKASEALLKQHKLEKGVAESALYLAEKRLIVEGKTTSAIEALEEAKARVSEIDERISDQLNSQVRTENSIRKEASDKALEYYNRELDAVLALNEAKIKAEGDYQTGDFAKRQEYERKLFQLSNEAELKKIEALKKHGKVTQLEYRSRLDVLNKEQVEFNNSQIKGMNDFFKSQISEISDMVDKSVDIHIKEVNERFAKAIKDLNNIQEPIQLLGQSDEDFAKEYSKYKDLYLEKAVLSSALEKQRLKTIEVLNEASIQKQLSDISIAVEKSNRQELARYVDNVGERNKVEIKALNEIIEQKKSAGLSILEDEASLRTLTSQSNAIALNRELLQNSENARAKYEARKIYLEKEKLLYKDNADKQIELNAQIAENDKRHMNERFDVFREYASSVMGLMSGINDLLNAFASADIQEYERANEEKKAILQDRFDSGLMSKEEYDTKVAESDAELDKQKLATARKQAIREKAMKVFEIGINTASSIMKNTAQLGFLPAIPINILTGILAGVQLATVAATPLPKASRGALIGGNSHAMGGTIIEAEKGEVIINKRSTAMFAPLLSMINEAGGGAPFTKPMSDGGFSARTNKPTSGGGITKSEMKTIIDEIKIYTTVEDYRRADKQYTEIVDNSHT